MSERERVVFLDIDGVLLTPRAWAMPVNASVIEMRRVCRRGGEAQWPWMDVVNFDPCGVGLVNRLCDVSGAKLVVSSSWRITYRGSIETVEKLVKQGIRRQHFHEDAYVPNLGRLDRKQSSIKEWLHEHQYSGDFICIDDEYHSDVHSYYPNLVRCKPSDGIGIDNYKDAVRFLDATDEEFGVSTLDEVIRAAGVAAGWTHYQIVQFSMNEKNRRRTPEDVAASITALQAVYSEQRLRLDFHGRQVRRRWKKWTLKR